MLMFCLEDWGAGPPAPCPPPLGYATGPVSSVFFTKEHTVLNLLCTAQLYSFQIGLYLGPGQLSDIYGSPLLKIK